MISRQDMILSLIKNEKITTQAELVSKLIEAGFDVTQATVSRDIKLLGIRKHSAWEGSCYYYDEKLDSIPEKYLRVLKDGYVSSEPAMNILVIKTVSGLAMAVAAALDACNFPELIGCIAGDDTIFAASCDIAGAKKIQSKIEELI